MQKESKRPFRIHQGLQGGRIHKHLAQERAVHRVLFDFYGLFFLAREFLVLRKKWVKRTGCSVRSHVFTILMILLPYSCGNQARNEPSKFERKDTESTFLECARVEWIGMLNLGACRPLHLTTTDVISIFLVVNYKLYNKEASLTVLPYKYATYRHLYSIYI